MNEDNIAILYENLKGQYGEEAVGTLEDFTARISDEKQRGVLYDNLSTDLGIEATGTREEFDNYLGFPATGQTQATSAQGGQPLDAQPAERKRPGQREDQTVEEFEKELRDIQTKADEAYRSGEGRGFSGWLNRRKQGFKKAIESMKEDVYAIGELVGIPGAEERRQEAVREKAKAEAGIPTRFKGEGVREEVNLYLDSDGSLNNSGIGVPVTIEVDSEGRYEYARDEDGLIIGLPRETVREFNKSGRGENYKRGTTGQGTIDWGTAFTNAEQTIYDIATLIGGTTGIARGVGKVAGRAAAKVVAKGVVASGAFIQSYSDNYQQALEETGDPNKASNIAVTQSAATALLTLAFGGFETQLPARLGGLTKVQSVIDATAKDFARGVISRKALISEFTKRLTKDVGLEIAEETSDAIASNIISGLNGIDTDVMSSDEFEELLLTTIIASSGAGSINAVQGLKTNILANSAYAAAENIDTFNEMVDDLVDSGEIKREEANSRKNQIQRVKTTLDNAGDLKTSEKVELSGLVLSKINAEKELAVADPTVRQRVLDKIEKIDAEINKIIGDDTTQEETQTTDKTKEKPKTPPEDEPVVPEGEEQAEGATEEQPVEEAETGDSGEPVQREPEVTDTEDRTPPTTPPEETPPADEPPPSPPPATEESETPEDTPPTTTPPEETPPATENVPPPATEDVAEDTTEGPIPEETITIPEDKDFVVEPVTDTDTIEEGNRVRYDGADWVVTRKNKDGTLDLRNANNVRNFARNVTANELEGKVLFNPDSPQSDQVDVTIKKPRNVKETAKVIEEAFNPSGATDTPVDGVSEQAMATAQVFEAVFQNFAEAQGVSTEDARNQMLAGITKMDTETAQRFAKGISDGTIKFQAEDVPKVTNKNPRKQFTEIVNRDNTLSPEEKAALRLAARKIDETITDEAILSLQEQENNGLHRWSPPIDPAEAKKARARVVRNLINNAALYLENPERIVNEFRKNNLRMKNMEISPSSTRLQEVIDELSDKLFDALVDIKNYKENSENMYARNARQLKETIEIYENYIKDPKTPSEDRVFYQARVWELKKERQLFLDFDAILTNKRNISSIPYSLRIMNDPMFKNKRGKYIKTGTIQQVLNQKGTKAIEKSIIKSVLEMPQFKGKKSIPFDDFEQAVELQLLPLRIISTTTWADHGRTEIKFDGDLYRTHIFNSNLDHGFFGKNNHFKDDFIKGRDKFVIEEKYDPGTGESIYIAIREGETLTQDNVQEVIGNVSRNREMVENWIKMYNAGGDVPNVGIFGHTRVWQKGNGYYVVEVQSDSFQEGKAQELIWQSYLRQGANGPAAAEVKAYNEAREAQRWIDGDRRIEDTKYGLKGSTWIRPSELKQAWENIKEELKSIIDISKLKIKDIKKELTSIEDGGWFKGRFPDDFKSDIYSIHEVLNIAERVTGVNVEIQDARSKLDDLLSFMTLAFPGNDLELAERTLVRLMEENVTADTIREIRESLSEDGKKGFDEYFANNSPLRLANRITDVKVILRFLDSGKIFQDALKERQNTIDRINAISPRARFDIAYYTQVSLRNPGSVLGSYLQQARKAENIEEGVKNANEYIKNRINHRLSSYVETGTAQSVYNTDMQFYSKYIEEEKKALAAKNKAIKNASIQDQQFIAHRKNFPERQLREEIRMAAVKGFKYLYLPTPRTVAGIEWDKHEGSKANKMPYDVYDDANFLEVGDMIEYASRPLEVVEADDSYFQAADESDIEMTRISDVINDEIARDVDDFNSSLEMVLGQTRSPERWMDVLAYGIPSLESTETEDKIKAKIKELWGVHSDGRVTINKPEDTEENQEEYRQAQNKLIELEEFVEELSQEYYENPANFDMDTYFGEMGTTMVGTEGDWVRYVNPGAATYRFSHPIFYEDKVTEETFDINSFHKEKEQPILKTYETLNETFKEMRPDAEMVDPNGDGIYWWRTEITPDDYGSVILFQGTEEEASETAFPPQSALAKQVYQAMGFVTSTRKMSEGEEIPIGNNRYMRTGKGRFEIIPAEDKPPLLVYERAKKELAPSLKDMVLDEAKRQGYEPGTEEHKDFVNKTFKEYQERLDRADPGIMEKMEKKMAFNKGALRIVEAFNTVTPEQLEIARQTYSEFLKQNPDGTISEFKEWFKERGIFYQEPSTSKRGKMVYRGATIGKFGAPKLLAALEQPNASTALHELAHIFEDFIDIIQEGARSMVLENYNNFTGENKTSWDVDVSEFFARSYEEYMRQKKNVKDTHPLKAVFDKFTEWLQNIYNGVVKFKGRELELSDDMKALFDKIMDQRTESQRTRGEQQINDTQANSETGLTEEQSKMLEDMKMNNATFEAVSRALGLDVGTTPLDGRKSLETQIAEAIYKGYTQPDAALGTAQLIISGKMDKIDPAQQIGLAYVAFKHANVIAENAAKLEEMADRPTTPEAIRLEQINDQLEGELEMLVAAFQQIGTSLGRGLNLRSRLLKLGIMDEQRTMDAMTRRKGEPLTAREKAKVSKFYKEYRQARKEFEEELLKNDKAREKSAEKSAQEAINEAQDTEGKATEADVKKAADKLRDDLEPYGDDDIKFQSPNAAQQEAQIRSDIYNLAVNLIKARGLKNLREVIDAIQEIFPNIGDQTISVALATHSRNETARMATDLEKQKAHVLKESKAFDEVDAVIRKMEEGPKNAALLKRFSNAMNKLRAIVFEDIDNITSGNLRNLMVRFEEAEGSIYRGDQELSHEDIVSAQNQLDQIRSLRNMLNVDQRVERLNQQISDLKEGDGSSLTAADLVIDKIQEKASLKAARKKLLDAQMALRDIAQSFDDQRKIEKGYEWLGELGKTKLAKAIKKWQVKVGRDGYEVFRSLLAMLDLSMVFNQAGLMTLASITRPHELRSAFFGPLWTSMKAFAKDFDPREQRFGQSVYLELMSDPMHKWREIAGLDIIEPGSRYNAEEWFESHLLDGTHLGRIKNSSESAYTTYMNIIRARTFDNMVKNDPSILTSEESLKAVGEMINTLTGRSKLPENIAGRTAGFVFFAPRYYWSRVKILGNLGSAGVMIKDKRARRLYREEMARAMGGYAIVAALATLMGFEHEWDPKKNQLLKLKLGDSAYDITGGLGQFIRLFAALGTQALEGMILPDGKKLNDKPSNQYFDNLATPFDTFARFLKYKFHPAINVFLMGISGEDAIGRPLGRNLGERLAGMAYRSLFPISLQSALDPLTSEVLTERKSIFDIEFWEEDLKNASASFFGIGVTDYDNMSKAKKVMDYFDDLGKQLPKSRSGKNDPDWLANSEWYKHYYKVDFQNKIGEWVYNELEKGNKPTSKQINKKARKIRKELIKMYEEKYGF